MVSEKKLKMRKVNDGRKDGGQHMIIIVRPSLQLRCTKKVFEVIWLLAEDNAKRFAESWNDFVFIDISAFTAFCVRVFFISFCTNIVTISNSNCIHSTSTLRCSVCP